jgi:hypothetical protein
VEWILDQNKEKAAKNPTIREKFSTYGFSGYKEIVIELTARLVTVSVKTVEITRVEFPGFCGRLSTAFHRGFEYFRAHASQVTVAPNAIVERLDV